ncbi:MAG: cytochrome c oxidase assembly protein, partial [Acidimicrobiales bacterium]
MVHHWTVQPLGWVVLAAAGLEVLGLARAGGAARAAGPVRWPRARAASTLAGLAVALVVLDGPIAHYARSLFWVDTLGYVVITVVAAPLVVAGSPWRVWRAALARRREPAGGAGTGTATGSAAGRTGTATGSGLAAGTVTGPAKARGTVTGPAGLLLAKAAAGLHRPVWA